MADNNDIKPEERIADLCKALVDENYEDVRKYCPDLPEGPLQIISIYNDTVLHMAAHSKQKDLVLDLLKMLPADRNQLSDMKNTDGNTILHEVATSNAMVGVAEELLKRDAKLLIAANELGEKPIFCAARYGQTEMFQFLANRMELERKSQSPEEISKADLQRKDGTTVLHISIATECFDLALFIAEHYPYLIEERDQSSMTALQYLARNPTAFRRGKTQLRQGFIERFISKSQVKRGFKELVLPFLKEMFCEGEDMKSNGSGEDMISNGRDTLKELTKILVEKYASWDSNINSQAVGLGESEKESEIEEHSSKLFQKNEGQNSKESSTIKYMSDESPLFLATMSNIEEIVEAVLTSQPQALKYTNKEGMNILHVAILYRHIHIFDMVVESKVFARRLLSTTDDQGNTVLHMVSQKRKTQASEKMQNPAFQLREELLLFEKVKSASKMLVSNPLNRGNKTAGELFATSNEELHRDAKEWLVRTTENCTILSVFIATVAFAAAYTLPGGPDQDTGIPILHSKPFFMVFILADVISLAFALTSVGIFLSILTSSFPLEDFKIYLFKKLIQGIIYLVLSVSMMAVAFGATIVLAMSHNLQNVVWSVIAFLPVPIFFLSYSPLRSAVLGPCTEWFKIFVVFFFKVVVIGILAIFSIPVLIIYLVIKGLSWIRKFIVCIVDCWIGKNQSDTQPLQSTSDAPLAQV